MDFGNYQYMRNCKVKVVEIDTVHFDEYAQERKRKYLGKEGTVLQVYDHMTGGESYTIAFDGETEETVNQSYWLFLVSEIEAALAAEAGT